MERRNGHFQDLRDLGGFIAGPWGALAAISIVLAALNSWLTFIPRHPSLDNIATALALIGAVFAFLYAYVEGEDETAYAEDPTGYRRGAPTPREPTLRAAFARFTWAVLSLAGYLTLLTLHGLVTGNRDPGPALVAAALVPALLILYAAIFGFLTAALTSLAVIHRIAARRTRARPLVGPRWAAEETGRILPLAELDGEEPHLAPDLQIDRAH